MDIRRLSSVHYYTLSIATILFFTGMTNLQDVAFLVCSIIYLVFLDRVVFPPSNVSISLLSVFGEKNLVVGFYLVFSAVIGIFLPFLYIFEGVVKGHSQIVSIVVPNLFLICSQVFMEGVTDVCNFSLPVQLFVSISYNLRITIVNWLVVDLGSVKDQNSSWRLSAGQGLVFANMLLWTFNLFGVLLPVFLPKVFKLYYADHPKKY